MWRVGGAPVGRCFGLWIGLLGLTGCSNPGYFVCTVDSECTEAENGRCEPSGACSIPDTTCPTGRRYGELGNPELAGQCVPADDIGSTGAETAGGSGSATSGTLTGSTAPGSSSDSEGPSETSDPVSSSGSSESTGATASGSSSSTGDAAPPDLWANCETSADCSELCAPVVDLVSLDPIGHWCTGFACDDPAADCTDPGTGATPACLPLEFDGRVASRCILDCTETGTAGCPEGMECFDVFMSTSRCAHPVAE